MPRFSHFGTLVLFAFWPIDFSTRLMASQKANRIISQKANRVISQKADSAGVSKWRTKRCCSVGTIIILDHIFVSTYYKL